jgi:acetyl esterase/lipase
MHIMLAETRRTVCGIVGYLIVSWLLLNTVAAEVNVQTYTYKQVRDLEIKVNVYRQDDEKVRPVVVWIHGGALIN